MSTMIDNLQIKIETSFETGAAGIRDLASALGELKKNGSLGLDYGIKTRHYMSAVLL